MKAEETNQVMEACGEAQGCLVWTLDARIQDISLAGMQVETSSRLDPLRRYSFRLGGEPEAITLDGHVVWSYLKGTERTEQEEIRPVYRAGIEFDNVLSPGADALLHFLESNAIVTVETRLFGRFGLREEDIIRLDTTVGFVVVRIDRVGLTIETAGVPQAGTACGVELTIGDVRLVARARVVTAHPLDDAGGRSRVTLCWEELDSAGAAIIARLTA